VNGREKGTSVSTKGSGPASATRRRGDALRQAIFDAVFEQLQSRGYAGLTMDGVAAAAGTGKAALYRRWAGKEDLVAAALRSALPSPADVPVQGSVRADLLALLRCMRDAFAATHDTAFQALKADGGPGSGLLAPVVQERVIEPFEQAALAALRRAVERGEARPGSVALNVARVGPAMLIHRTLTEGPELPDSYLTSIVDEVILPLVRA
jgi:AcrR family transcriptional regulator